MGAEAATIDYLRLGFPARAQMLEYVLDNSLNDGWLHSERDLAGSDTLCVEQVLRQGLQELHLPLH